MLAARLPATAAGFAFLSLALAGSGASSPQSRGAHGVELTLRAVPGVGERSITLGALDRAAGILRERLQALGHAGTVTVRSGSDVLVVRVDGSPTPVRVDEIHLLTKVAQLWMFDFEGDITGPSVGASGNPVAQPTLYGLLAQVQKQASNGSPAAYYLFLTTRTTTTTQTKTSITKNGKKTTVLKPVKTTRVTHKPIGGPASTRAALLKPYGGSQPAGTQIMAVPAHRTIIQCAASTGCIGAGTAGTSPSGGAYYYLFKYFPHRTRNPIPEMNGGDLVLSGTRANFGQNNQPIVTLQFTRRGSKVFERVTRDEWKRGKRNYALAGSPSGEQLNYVQHFAIVLDGELESTPYIDFTNKSLRGGIASSSAEIDLFGRRFRDAKDLALVLRTGALPFQLELVSKRVVH